MIFSRRNDGEQIMITAHPNGRVFWAGLLLILAAFTATAQEFRGSLAGKIVDPNGAVVPGSKVEIKNVETGIVSNTTTGEDGTYSFALLPPGKYQLTVTKENFNTAVRDGIQVRVADRLTLDVQLEIGVTAMVTTVASGLTLDTGTVNTGTVVTSCHSPKDRHINSRRSLPVSLTPVTRSSPDRRRTVISQPFVPTAPPARTRSHSTALRTTRLTAAWVSLLRLTQYRNSKSKQIHSTRSRVTPPARP
jgi:hypothetical protein